MGYAGGESTNPKYRSLGGHSEAIQIDFDPAIISYKDLLEVFWDEHDPFIQSWSQQYRNILFYHSDEQKKIAEASRDKLASETKGKIVTDIKPFKAFYLAEDYHQKNTLRMYGLITEEFEKIYPDLKAFIASTAVARVNGYLGGNGSCDMLKAEITKLGLSDRANQKLLDQVCAGNKAASCFGSSCR